MDERQNTRVTETQTPRRRASLWKRFRLSFSSTDELEADTADDTQTERVELGEMGTATFTSNDDGESSAVVFQRLKDEMETKGITDSYNRKSFYRPSPQSYANVDETKACRGS